jgi:SAM-dependent methyltransferase
MNMNATAIASYDDIAAEYYDALRHPTCANFLELSAIFLVHRIEKYAPAAGAVLEVGTGRSIVAPAMAAQQLPLARLTLLDRSGAMLAHSREWERSGARLLVADAASTGLPAAGFALIVASLGDPYNGAGFWREISRLLGAGGVCLFTTPTPEWSESFRSGSDRKAAEFLLANGKTVLVRSEIPPVAGQTEMISAAGLQVDEIEAFDTTQLSGAVSPKLLIDGRTDALPVVRGFTVRKRSPDGAKRNPG